LLIRKLDASGRFHDACGRIFGGKAGILWLVLLGVLFWLGEQTLIQNPRPESPDGLLNLYKPLFYLIPFLLGYFVFSNDAVQEQVGKYWIPLLACAAVAGVVLIVTTFGQDNTSPQYLGSPLNCLYGWLACLAMMAWFKARFDRTSAFAGYMTRSSFGIYIVHYLVIASLGYMMKQYTQLPPWAMYVILAAAVFTLSPLLYEILRRIPFIRWCVLGEKKR
ncbi:MAG: acyltransferase family protein, partial [Bacteroidales bacterium]|nr:acyltransferase family protein [Bacteroidales bacterium]